MIGLKLDPYVSFCLSEVDATRQINKELIVTVNPTSWR